MQMVQDFHMRDRDWHDIGLNFLVGGDGEIYEGRGWDVRAQPLRGYESVSISIAFIGTFSNVEPRERQVKAAKRLMEEGVRRKKLRQDYNIYGQRQFQPTEKSLEACQLLLEQGVRLKKLKPDYQLLGHRQVTGTLMPAEELYRIIQTWPHWYNLTKTWPDLHMIQ